MKKTILKEEDDGSVLDIFAYRDGTFQKVINATPYIGIEIEKKEFDTLKQHLIENKEPYECLSHFYKKNE